MSLLYELLTKCEAQFGDAGKTAIESNNLLFISFFLNSALLIRPLHVNSCCRVCSLQEADIAAGALIVTETLRQYVDFTEPFLSMRWSALLRRPTDAHNSRRAPASRGSATGSGRRQSVSSMSPPGGGMGPRRLTTATQLLRSDAVCGVVENSVAHQMIATSTDPVARALYQRMTLASLSASSHRGGSGHSSSSDPFVRSVQEGVDRARRENYAFILDSPTAEYVASREPCDLYTVEPFLDVATYAFAVRKQGPQSGAASSSSSSANHADDSRQLRQAIDREMRRMKQSGEMQAMYLRWWRDECAASVGAVDDEFAFVANSGTGRRPSQPDSADTYAGDVSRRHTRVSSVAAVPSSRLAGGADWRTVATVCCCVAVATTVAGISDLLTLFGLDKYYRR